MLDAAFTTTVAVTRGSVTWQQRVDYAMKSSNLAEKMLHFAIKTADFAIKVVFFFKTTCKMLQLKYSGSTRFAGDRERAGLQIAKICVQLTVIEMHWEKKLNSMNKIESSNSI